MNTQRAMLALVINKFGEILAVSKRDNHEEFGFPGGKPEKIDWDAPMDNPEMACVKREVKEETGYDIDIFPENQYGIYTAVDEFGFTCTTYIGMIIGGKLNSSGDTAEGKTPGKAAWVKREVLETGPYAKYNKEVFAKIDELSNKIRVGDCYENTDTEEIFYVTADHQERRVKDDYIVVESSFTDSPMIIPRRMLQGKVKWVPREKFDASVKFAEEVLNTSPQDFMYGRLVQKAKIWAIGKHNSTNHYYGKNHLYSWHLAHVVKVGLRFKHLIPDKDWAVVEATLWTHDAPEDARVTRNDVKKALGEKVADGSYAMTNEKGRNRDERGNDKYYSGLREILHGEFKKGCDRAANAEFGILERGETFYSKEHDDFKKKLKSENSPYQELWDYLDQILTTNKVPI